MRLSRSLQEVMAYHLFDTVSSPADKPIKAVITQPYACKQNSFFLEKRKVYHGCLQEDMEQAIENATHQTAQDLHLLLDEARPPTDPHATPLGKENMATPAGGMDRKNNRGTSGALRLDLTSLQAVETQHYCCGFSIRRNHIFQDACWWA